jgi:hypothetical protein
MFKQKRTLLLRVVKTTSIASSHEKNAHVSDSREDDGDNDDDDDDGGIPEMISTKCRTE